MSKVCGVTAAGFSTRCQIENHHGLLRLRHKDLLWEVNHGAFPGDNGEKFCSLGCQKGWSHEIWIRIHDSNSNQLILM